MNHTHIHCIIPGGGLSLDQSKWIKSKKKFFILVKVLSRTFRGKFLYYLNNKLKFASNISELGSRDVFSQFKDFLYKKKWIVYSKPPFGGAEHVLQYISRYTHRVAISDNKITKVDNDNVVFKWRDYKDNK